MKVIARHRIEQYCTEYPNARGAILAWYNKVKSAHYQEPRDVQADWGKDCVLSDEVLVFNIKGNSYRIVVRVNYPAGAFYVRWFGTHAEYDRIDVFRV